MKGFVIPIAFDDLQKYQAEFKKEIKKENKYFSLMFCNILLALLEYNFLNKDFKFIYHAANIRNKTWEAELLEKAKNYVEVQGYE